MPLPLPRTGRLYLNHRSSSCIYFYCLLCGKWEVKKRRRTEKKKGKSSNNKEEGAVYQINCKDCETIHIGETQFKIGKRIGQHKKDIQYRRENSAVVKHVLELGHQIDWDTIECLEKEKIKIPRRIIEGCHLSHIYTDYQLVAFDVCVYNF